MPGGQCTQPRVQNKTSTRASSPRSHRIQPGIPRAMPASRRQNHTTSPSASASLVSTPFDRSQALSARPAITSHAQRCRVHRIPCPTSVTIAIRPSSGAGRKRFRVDLGQARREIFLQMGLDSQFTDLPVGQIRLIRFKKFTLSVQGGLAQRCRVHRDDRDTPFWLFTVLCLRGVRQKTSLRSWFFTPIDAGCLSWPPCCLPLAARLTPMP
jgi:hypothetical protein